MNSLCFESEIPDIPGFRADAMAEGALFEVLIEPRDVRQLRAALLDLARAANSKGIRRAILVLEEPQITNERLGEEWEGAIAVVRPELSERLVMLVRRAGEWTGTPEPPKANEIPLLEQILQRKLSRRSTRPGRGAAAHYEILRILIYYWLLDKGPLAINELMKVSGTSHPTVSRALERLDHCLQRHSDRSVELRYFPRDEWKELVAVSANVRNTVRFVDRSGQPRSLESLLRRLQKLQRQDIAVGGVTGAKHYLPSLDLIGSSRLDLSLLSASKIADLSFVERLDPALQKTTRRDETPLLVVHTIRRAASFFQPNEKTGIAWADPVECLLDLHEARLEPQALEFLNSFPPMKRP